MSQELPASAAYPQGQGGTSGPESGLPRPEAGAAPAGDWPTSEAGAAPADRAATSAAAEAAKGASALAAELLQMELPQRLRALQQMEARLADDLREAGA